MALYELFTPTRKQDDTTQIPNTFVPHHLLRLGFEGIKGGLGERVSSSHPQHPLQHLLANSTNKQVNPWQPGVDYNHGDCVEYKGATYRIIQPHFSQGDWTPDVTPALWGREYGAAPTQPPQQSYNQPPPEQRPWDQHDQTKVEFGEEEKQKNWYDLDPERRKQLEASRIKPKACSCALMANRSEAAFLPVRPFSVVASWLTRSTRRTRRIRRLWPGAYRLSRADCATTSGKPTWVLTKGNRIPQGAFQAGQESDGTPLYVGHPGKVSPNFQKGCIIGYGGDEIEVEDYEILIADPRSVRWAEASGTCNPQYLGAQPVEGGREQNGPLYIVQAPYKEGTHPGKTGPHLQGADITYGGKEKKDSASAGHRLTESTKPTKSSIGYGYLPRKLNYCLTMFRRQRISKSKELMEKAKHEDRCGLLQTHITLRSRYTKLVALREACPPGVGRVLGQRRRLVALVVALERVAHRRQAGVRVRLGFDRRYVPKVRVHACKQLAVASDDVADLHLALDLGAAVAARAVQLAKVLDLGAQLTSAVVLDDLVGRALSASAGNGGGAGALPDGDGVLAHVLEPDVADGARALAVHTLVLVCTDHGVTAEYIDCNLRKSSAGLEDEDGVLGAALLLTAALDTTAVAEVLACESTLDGASCGQLDVGGCGWVGERAAGRALLRRSRERSLSEHAGDDGKGSERELNHDGVGSSSTPPAAFLLYITTSRALDSRVGTVTISCLWPLVAREYTSSPSHLDHSQSHLSRSVCHFRFVLRGYTMSCQLHWLYLAWPSLYLAWPSLYLASLLALVFAINFHEINPALRSSQLMMLALGQSIHARLSYAFDATLWPGRVSKYDYNMKAMTRQSWLGIMTDRRHAEQGNLIRAPSEYQITCSEWPETADSHCPTTTYTIMVQLSLATLAIVAGMFAQTALAAPSEKRAASCSFPNPSASTNVKLSAARTIKAGETFDGKNLRYGRGVKCGGQKEGGTKDAVFILESGATLANAVIGADQNEGVHCQGPCTIRNVWFEDVCEDAITIRQSSGTSTITGGGAKSASDKVVQHNGGGELCS
ncbi:pectate lyase domain-containing protein [Rhizoctonia solani AG-1 IA]|uniref:Probable pectate lyase F n=1 Tax=Thanatephorus cucumeris (strain AG1-IA) TaxID=983506 RepID=L8X457_THACA|nr:pectate lyase domain-containing protein [Rhizoctonia solani AG-1 IA]